MTDPAVRRYLDAVTPARRRRDAEVLMPLMARITGLEPQLSGSIVGFGQYHYRYASGREGLAFGASFAARKAALTVYLLDGIGSHTAFLAQLGPHRTGVGCLYINDLEDVDLGVLESIVGRSYETLTSEVFTHRAREGGS